MTRSISIISLAILMAFSATAAFADVKVRSKQTMAGQSYENTTYIKGKRQRTETMGGMVNITQCDLKRGIQVNTNSQTYMVTPFAATTQSTTTTSPSGVDKDGVVQTGGVVTTTITTKDTGERKQMFGYTARRLIITIETVSSPDACSKSDTKMQTDGWYIDAAFALDCDAASGYYGGNYNNKVGCRDRYQVKTIGTAKRGFAVYEKMTMFDGSGRETYSMVNEVIEFSQATLDPALFDVPAAYREVKNAAEMYASASQTAGTQLDADHDRGKGTTTSAVSTAISSAAASTPAKSAPGPKKEGVVRIGIPAVKTGPVGEGITAAELSVAIRNTLVSSLNSPNVEVVLLEARLDDAVAAEAKEKDCDFVVSITASHKKGGGFGMFKSFAPLVGSIVPVASAAGTGAYIAAQTAVTAATISAQVKNKDEITLDLKLTDAAGSPAATRSFRSKARSNGDDIVSQSVEQAAAEIRSTVAKK